MEGREGRAAIDAAAKVVGQGEVDGHSPQGFYRKGEQKDIAQHGHQGAYALRIDEVAHQYLIENRWAATEKEGEEARECDDAQGPDLHQHGDDEPPGGGECRRRVDGRQARHAHGAGGHEKGIDIAQGRVGALGKHQQQRPNEDENQETDR